MKLTWKQEACVCVIAASEGYPGEYKAGFPISGLKSEVNNMVFNAGTKIVGRKGAVHREQTAGFTAIIGFAEDPETLSQPINKPLPVTL